MTIAMPPSRRIETNGIGLNVFEAGPADSAFPPLVLCHGFPELAFSWRHQIPALAAQGFRVIAPDQRGYGGSDKPAAIEAYHMEQLTGDLAGLLDALGLEKAVFVGHDWGGFVIWQMGIRYPDRVAGLIGLNTPYTKRTPIDPIALYRQRFGDDFYIVFFQQPGAAEALFEADVERFIRFMMRRNDISPEVFEKLPKERRSFSLQGALPHYDPKTCTQQFLSDDEIGVFVDAFKAGGLTGPINWYRNFSRNWERSGHLQDLVTAPSLMIMAENDLVLPPSAADGMERYVPNLSRVLIRGSGHWTQQEKPVEATAAIADWMRATFAPR
jgi:pimeloyl-ACP methyl ester carboxylesterase